MAVGVTVFVDVHAGQGTGLKVLVANLAMRGEANYLVIR
jgi:hypothetical protein